MRAFFSVAAYKNYDKVAAFCNEAEKVANKTLREKSYEKFKFLTARFSFISLFDSQELTIEDENTLHVEVPVFLDKDEPTDLIEALLSNLDSPLVPDELKADLEKAFGSKGWLS